MRTKGLRCTHIETIVGNVLLDLDISWTPTADNNNIKMKHVYNNIAS